MSDKILTQEGFEKLQKELKELKEVRLPDIIDKIEKAKELGDLSENAEYHDAKDQQGLMVSRISELENILKSSIVSEKSDSKHEINLGTNFIVSDENGQEKEFTIVGYNEADPSNGKISNESPMAQAFVGQTVGQTVEVTAPRGIVKYTIVKII